MLRLELQHGLLPQRIRVHETAHLQSESDLPEGRERKSDDVQLRLVQLHIMQPVHCRVPGSGAMQRVRRHAVRFVLPHDIFRCRVAVRGHHAVRVDPGSANSHIPAAVPGKTFCPFGWRDADCVGHHLCRRRPSHQHLHIVCAYSSLFHVHRRG